MFEPIKHKAYLLLIIFFITCSSAPKMKPRPSDGNYEKCPNCHATGIITVRESPRFNNDLQNRDKQNDEKAACCLLPVWLVAEGTDEENRSKDLKIESDKTGKPVLKGERKIQLENNESLEKNVPEKSMIEKQVTCPRCKGMGWVEYTPQKTPQVPYDYQKLRELNESINRPPRS